MIKQLRERWDKMSVRTRSGLGLILCVLVLLPGLIELRSVDEISDNPSGLTSVDRVAHKVFAKPPSAADLDIGPGQESAPQPVAAIEGIPERLPTEAAPGPSHLPHYLVDRSDGFNDDGAPVISELHDCIIEPHVVIDVGSALTAVVRAIDVERSDFVERGQVLAELESSTERAAVAVARARATMDGEVEARQARMELDRRKQKRADRLFDNNAISDDIRDEFRTQAKVADAALKEARERKVLMELEHVEAVQRLEEHTIRSPVSGVVVERLKSVGEVVKEETILVVAEIDPLQVEVILPAAAFGTIHSGMHAEISPETPNLGVQIASVSVVDPVVDGTSGTFGVRLELPNPDHTVPSGLRCQVRFIEGD
jgi:RND family efflux transporter MFP subunit